MFERTTEQEPVSDFIYVLTAFSCIGGFLFGYDTGVISGALVQLADKFELSDFEKELVVSMTVAGAFVAAIVAGPMSDIYGRRPVILAASLVFIVGAFLMAFAESFEVLVVGRFIVGLGVGAASTSMPVFVSEAAEPKTRGMLVTCVNMTITFGQFVAAVISGAFISMEGGWRYMVGLAALPAAIQFIGFLYLPESPRWLIESGHVDKAVMSLRKLRGRHDVREEVQSILTIVLQEKEEQNQFNKPKASKTSGRYSAITDAMTTAGSDPVDSAADDDYPEARVSVHTGQLNGGKGDTDSGGSGSSTEPNSSVFADIYASVQKIWSEPTIYRALLLGCFLQMAQQIAGINTVMYYTATILKLAGFTKDSEAVWLSAVVALFNVIGSLIGLALVEKSGRRKLTLRSLFAVSLVLAGIAVAFYEAEHQSPAVDMNSLGKDSQASTCNSYEWCFDCTQDENCGYCSYYITGGSACIPGNSTDPALSESCESSEYYGESCPNSAITGWCIFMLLCLYLLVFAPGMGVMPWTINAEIYPTPVRGIANSIATSVNWAANFAMSASFLTVMTALTRQGAFLLYSIISLIFFCILYKYLPETKDMTLEDIRKLFSGRRWGKGYQSLGNKGERRSAKKSRQQSRDGPGDLVEDDAEPTVFSPLQGSGEAHQRRMEQSASVEGLAQNVNGTTKHQSSSAPVHRASFSKWVSTTFNRDAKDDRHARTAGENDEDSAEFTDSRSYSSGSTSSPMRAPLLASLRDHSDLENASFISM